MGWRCAAGLLAAVGLAVSSGQGVRAGTAPVFGEPRRIPVPADFAGSAALVVDLDGDRAPDIVAAGQHGLVAILNERPGWRAGWTWPRPSTYVRRHIAAGDVNGDGWADVVASDASGPLVFLATGRGTFRDPPDGGGEGGAEAPCALADLDGDGTLDLVTGAAQRNGLEEDRIHVHRGRGDGSFDAPRVYRLETPPPPPPIVGGGGYHHPHGILTPDLDGDGVADLVLTGDIDWGWSFRPAYRVLMSHGGLSFDDLGSRPVGNEPGRSFAATGGFDRGALPDLALAPGGLGSSALAILLGRGDGTFHLRGDVPLFSHLGGPVEQVATGDFDGDRVPDLLAVGWDAAAVSLGNGDGSFGAPQRYPARGASGPTSIGIGDLDGDRRDDAVLPGGPDGLVLLLTR